MENLHAIPLAKFRVKQARKSFTIKSLKPVEFMTFLLPYADGVDLDESGASHMAAVERRLEMVKLLLGRGCDPNRSHGYCSILVDRNTYDEFGYPLNYGAFRRDGDIIRAPVAKGANPKLPCDVAPDAYKYLWDEKGVVAHEFARFSIKRALRRGQQP